MSNNDPLLVRKRSTQSGEEVSHEIQKYYQRSKFLYGIIAFLAIAVAVLIGVLLKVMQSSQSHDTPTPPQPTAVMMALDLLKKRINNGQYNRTTCPCDHEDDCLIINKNYTHEIYAYGAADYPGQNPPSYYLQYDWDTLTSLVWNNFSDHKVMCRAHQSSVRILYKVNIGGGMTSNITERAWWLVNTMETLLNSYFDGVTVDYEKDLLPNDTKLALLTETVSDLSSAIHTLHVQYKIDAAWFYTPYDRPYYNYSGLIDALDRVYLMGYADSGSDRCLAIPDGQAYKLQQGAQAYLDQGIDKHKLIQGVGWQSAIYDCNLTSMESIHSGYCPTCYHDEEHKHYSRPAYTLAQSIISNAVHDGLNTTHLVWDACKECYKMNYWKDSNKTVLQQIFINDPHSCAIKYQNAKKQGLLGVGPWALHMLGYGNKTDAMWQALRDVF